MQEKVTLVTPSTKVPTLSSLLHMVQLFVKVLLGHYNKSPVVRWQLFWKPYFLQQFQRKKIKSDPGEESWSSQGLIRKQNPLENLK